MSKTDKTKPNAPTPSDEPTSGTNSFLIPLKHVYIEQGVGAPWLAGKALHEKEGREMWLDLRARLVFVKDEGRDLVFFDSARAKGMIRKA